MLDMLFDGNAAVFGAPAILGTLLFAARLIMLMVGGHDAGLDVAGADPGDLHHGDPGEAFKALSFQGLVAFAMGFGWVGAGCLKGSGMAFAPSFLLGLVGGVGMVWVMGLMMKGLHDLQTSGNIPLAQTLLHEGSVYLTVPEPGKGRGQVKLTVNDRQRIYDAVSDDAALPTGTRVRVTRINDDQTVTVSRA